MAYTKVQIISIALGKIGHKPIISLEGQSDIVTSADQAFDFFLPAILSIGEWRFATRITQLSQLVEVPPTQSNWSYIYQLPADYLGLVRLYPQNYDFEIYENAHLYSNLNNPLWIEYRFVPAVGRLSPLFGVYFSYEIAAYLALSNAQYAQYSDKIEQQRDIKYAQAMAADAQNRPNTPILSQPIITNRAVSGFYNNG